MITLILAVIALGAAAYDLIRSHGQSVLGWGVLALALIVILGAVKL